MPLSGTVGGPDACAFAFQTSFAFFSANHSFVTTYLGSTLIVNLDGQKNSPSLLSHYVSHVVRTTTLLNIMICLQFCLRIILNTDNKSACY